MRLNDIVRDCVAFIGPGPSSSNPTPPSRGTAFFASIMGETGYAYGHLVTAKHVALQNESQDLVVRMNMRAGGLDDLVIGKGRRWFFHPTDPSVDIAILPSLPDASVYDYKMFPASLFAAGEVLAKQVIGPGDEVHIVGLLYGLAGRKRIAPIVRTGHLARMATEPVPTVLGDTEAYLIEALSIGGFSGSPVFVRHSVQLPDITLKSGRRTSLTGAGDLYLLGLVHGHWAVPPELQTNSTTDPTDRVNSGIAIVVPATKLLEVMDHPELLALRGQRDAELRQQLTLPIGQAETGETKATE